MEALIVENENLRQQLQLLIENQDRAKRKISEYVHYNNLEVEDLAHKGNSLREQVTQLTGEVNALRQAQRQSQVADGAASAEMNDEDVELENGEIKAATVEKLIEALYLDFGSKQSTQSTQYVHVFLLTYRAFTTAHEVMDFLIAGYQQVIADTTRAPGEQLKARLRIGNFMKKWVNDNYFDFSADPMLVEKFAQFVHDVMSRNDAKLSESLKTNLMQKQKGIQRRFSQAMFSKPAPSAFFPKTEVTSILDINVVEIARQLTLIDYNLCRAIEPQECIGCAWTKDNKEERSPNLLKMINRFNSVSLWVSVTLVSEPNIRKRTRLLSHLLSVLPHLRELNNFGALFQIIGGLGNSAVFRLAKTFDQLNPAKKKILDEMRFLCKPDQSWKNYRTELHGANPPCVPFVGVYQTDLTFIEDGNPSKFSSGLINFKKCRLIASVISEIQQYQQKPYNLTAVQPIFEFMQSSLPAKENYTDKALYELSLAAEPRATA